MNHKLQAEDFADFVGHNVIASSSEGDQCKKLMISFNVYDKLMRFIVTVDEIEEYEGPSLFNSIEVYNSH